MGRVVQYPVIPRTSLLLVRLWGQLDKTLRSFAPVVRGYLFVPLATSISGMVGDTVTPTTNLPRKPTAKIV